MNKVSKVCVVLLKLMGSTFFKKFHIKKNDFNEFDKILSTTCQLPLRKLTSLVSLEVC
jgi:hypothetical protein